MPGHGCFSWTFPFSLFPSPRSFPFPSKMEEGGRRACRFAQTHTLKQKPDDKKDLEERGQHSEQLAITLDMNYPQHTEEEAARVELSFLFSHTWRFAVCRWSFSPTFNISSKGADVEGDRRKKEIHIVCLCSILVFPHVRDDSSKQNRMIPLQQQTAPTQQNVRRAPSSFFNRNGVVPHRYGFSFLFRPTKIFE